MAVFDLNRERRGQEIIRIILFEISIVIRQLQVKSSNNTDATVQYSDFQKITAIRYQPRLPT